MKPCKPIGHRLDGLVERRSPDECWPYTGSLGSSGYGRISLGGRGSKQIGAHVAAWQEANGRQVPPGLEVRHACDNRVCCNPAHLSVGTRRDNMQDAVARGRIAREFRLPPTVLSDAEVCEVRALYQRPTHNESNAKELAARFGVSVQHIQLIVNKKRRGSVA